MSTGLEEETLDDPFWRGYRMVGEMKVPLSEEDLLHPLEGDVIVQNDLHRRDVMYLFSVLETVLGGREGFLVLGDHRVDWGDEEIEPHGPDVVVFENAGVWDRRQLATYPAGTLGARPVLVIEVTSESTRNNDLGRKREQYLALGVPYYLIVDRHAGRRHDRVRLLAQRRAKRSWQAVPLDDLGRLNLPGLSVAVGLEDGSVVCYRADGEPYPVYSDAMRRIEEEVAARDDALRRLAAEEVRRILAEEATRQAEQARAQAEETARQESAAARQAEETARQAEAARLREEQARLRAEEASRQDRAARLQAEQTSQQDRLRMEEQFRTMQEAMSQMQAEMERVRTPGTPVIEKGLSSEGSAS